VGLREYHTKDKVHFEIEMNEAFFNKLFSGPEDLSRF